MLTNSFKISRSANEALNTLEPTSGSTYVGFWLGEVNIRQYREGERLRLKHAYEKFRAKTNTIFLLLSLSQLFISIDLVLRLWLLWLLYYYLTLSLRENILKANGSNIRPWFETP
jgi:hypothetical protein